jgi:hypothetical protein
VKLFDIEAWMRPAHRGGAAAADEASLEQLVDAKAAIQ